MTPVATENEASPWVADLKESSEGLCEDTVEVTCELWSAGTGLGSLTVLASPKETGELVKRTDLKVLQIQAGEQTSYHYHLLAESVFYICSGRVTARGAEGPGMDLESGDVLVVPPREPHQLECSASGPALILETQSPPYAPWDTFPSEKSPPNEAEPPREGRFWEGLTNSNVVQVKICGVRSLEAALACAEAGCSAVGLNLTYGSRGLARLDHWLEWIPAIPSKLSVFVLTDSELPDEVEVLARLCNADTIQLQGRCSVESVRALSERCKQLRLRLVKSIGLESDPDAIGTYCESLVQSVDAFLFDTSWRGGTGRRVEGDTLAAALKGIQCPVIIAGGLNPGNVRDIIAETRAKAVDVETGVEVRLRGLAVKSPAAIKSFVEAAQSSAK